MSDKGPWGESASPLPAVIEAIKLSCPSCGEENEITPGSSLRCAKCNKPLGGKDSYFRFGLGPFFLLVALASGGTWGVMELLSENRYPVLVEHAVMEDCLSQSRAPLARSHYIRKREICACALEKTQQDLSQRELGYSSSKKRRYWNAEHVKIFEEHAADC